MLELNNDLLYKIISIILIILGVTILNQKKKIILGIIISIIGIIINIKGNGNILNKKEEEEIVKEIKKIDKNELEEIFNTITDKKTKNKISELNFNAS